MQYCDIQTDLFNNGVKGMGMGMGICRDAAAYALVAGGGGGGKRSSKN